MQSHAMPVEFKKHEKGLCIFEKLLVCFSLIG